LPLECRLHLKYNNNIYLLQLVCNPVAVMTQAEKQGFVFRRKGGFYLNWPVGFS